MLLLLAALLPAAVSCQKDDPLIPEEETDSKGETYYVNQFAFNIMSNYYLWLDEVEDKIKGWKVNSDPFEKIEEIRYKDASGNVVDRWTMLTDDFESFTSSVAGTGLTYGLDAKFYYVDETKKNVCAVVTYTYKDSPAAKAGLSRGDVINKVNGKEMTPDNYVEIANNELFGGTSVKLSLSSGKEISMTAVKMYDDPVHTVKTFSHGGVKYGYLHFTDFTLSACVDLVDVAKQFKSEGVEILVLDLRYNGGGYAITAEVLASMIAPEKDVKARAVFMTEVYNSKVAEMEEDNKTPFTTSFVIDYSGSDVTVNTADANMGLKALYVITDTGTASASESLICGLMPYMDVVLAGKQTHGKYCSGLVIGAEDWYDAVKDQLGESEYKAGVKNTGNWGIYVMYSRFADKDGITACMPDGITPSIDVADNPFDGKELGDPSETMLSALLNGVTKTAETSVPAALPGVHKKGFGVMIHH